MCAPRRTDRLFVALGLIVLAGSVSCRRAAPAPEKAAPVTEASAEPRSTSPGRGAAAADLWFKGSPEQAFIEAKAKGKLVFFYWGAAWCPPCNRLKAEVFSTPRFAELMKSFVAVHLDGDDEAAQTWGEALKTQAYPTILVLTPEREELFRLTSLLAMSELEAALLPILGESRAFADAVARCDAGKATPADVRLLAYVDWGQLPDAKWDAARKLSVLRGAWDACPPSLRAERSRLAVDLISLALESEGDASLAGPLGALRAKGPAIIDSVLTGAESTWAARIFVTTWTRLTVGWLFGADRGEAYLSFKKRWLGAAASIRNHEGASAEIRLLSAGPSLDFHKLESPSAPPPEALRAQIEEAVRDATERAKTEADKHAVASHAAFFLRTIGQVDRARSILLAEAARSDVPWYSYSSLSALEQQVGDERAAKAWSAKARQGARGPASRIQWIVNDLELNVKASDPAQKAYLLSVAAEYYEAATSIPDGFLGRSGWRAQHVANLLGPWRDDPEFAALLARYGARCEALAGENAVACRKHFAK